MASSRQKKTPRREETPPKARPARKKKTRAKAAAPSAGGSRGRAMKKEVKATPKADEKAIGTASTVTREELGRTHEAWYHLWLGTLGLLERQAPRAHRLLLAKLRRHGSIATAFSLVANPSSDGTFALTLTDHPRPEPIPEMPQPPTTETLTRLRGFAQDYEPVQDGRPRSANPVAMYYVFDWTKRHLTQNDGGGGRRLTERALELMQERLTQKYEVESLGNLVNRGRRETQRERNAQRGPQRPNPLDELLLLPGLPNFLQL